MDCAKNMPEEVRKKATSTLPLLSTATIGELPGPRSVSLDPAGSGGAGGFTVMLKLPVLLASLESCGTQAKQGIG